MVPLIKPGNQKDWGWPAVLNFGLGGAGAAFFILLGCLRFIADAVFPPFWVLFSPSLICLGFLGLTLEAGRPFRARFALRHLGRSWMSRESLAAALFIPASLVCSFTDAPVVWDAAALAALGFIVSQGFILRCARAVPAWNHPLIPAVIASSAFVGGMGLLLFLSGLTNERLGSKVIIVSLGVMAVDLGVWSLYLFGRSQQSFRRATEQIRRPMTLIRDSVVTRVIPALLLSCVLFAFSNPGNNFQKWTALLGLAGLLLFSASIAQKACLIRRCGHLREIGLPLRPNLVRSPG
jgi:DMSO reductase anchor subunit